MTEVFRSRSGRVVPPELRPRKQRRAARVLIVADQRVLLFTDTDPGVPGSSWWITPGGGIDPGETVAQAAVREVFEETGLVIAEADLRGPIAHRVVVHGYSDQILVQEEWFHRVDLAEPFVVDTRGFTELEKLTMTDHRWFDATELAQVEVWPHQVAQLMQQSPDECLDLGEMDESTVPV